MVPPPWFNIRFHGVFAPNAKLRGQVVASARPYVPPQENTAPNALSTHVETNDGMMQTNIVVLSDLIV